MTVSDKINKEQIQAGNKALKCNRELYRENQELFKANQKLYGENQKLHKRILEKQAKDTGLKVKKVVGK